MAGLVPAIHVFVTRKKVVDARHTAGHYVNVLRHAAAGFTCREIVLTQTASVDDALHRNCSSFAAADAQRRDAALQVLRLQRMQQRDDQARAGGADRVT